MTVEARYVDLAAMTETPIVPFFGPAAGAEGRAASLPGWLPQPVVIAGNASGSITSRKRCMD